MKSLLQHNHKTNLLSYSGNILSILQKKSTSILHRNFNSLQHLDSYYLTGLATKNVPMIATVIEDVSLGNINLSYANNNFGGFCNHIDILGQVNPWNLTPYSIQSLFHNMPKFYNKLDSEHLTQINTGGFNQKVYVDKRLNTTQEIICANAAPKFMSINKLSFNNAIYNIPFNYKNLTGQSRPDYLGCWVTLDGDQYIYYIDLKRTTLKQFEMTVQGQLTGKNVYCNIHVLGDVNQNHVFSSALQPFLIKSYHDVYNFNIKSNDLIAIKVANSSLPHFNYFLIKRDIDSWNRIPLNTSKFLTLDMLKNFYN